MDRFELDFGERVLASCRARSASTRRWPRARQALDSPVFQHRFRQLERRIEEKRLARTPYVKPGARPDEPILSRAEAIARMRST